MIDSRYTLLKSIVCYFILIFKIEIDASLVPLVPPTNERKGILVNPPDRPITKEDKDRIFTGSSWEVSIYKLNRYYNFL